MPWPLTPLRPKWHAALRDVAAHGVDARVAAAVRLGEPDNGEQREQALPALARLASDRDARVRGAAVQALGALEHEGSAAALRQSLSDSHALVRELATIALGQLSWESAGDALLAATRSEYPELRFQAIVIAATRCPERALPHIERLLDDPDDRVRASAVQAAGLLEQDARSRRLVAKLTAALRDPAPAVRRQAAILTASDRPHAAIPGLLEALGDPELAFDALEVAGRLRDRALTEQVASMAQRVLGSRLLAAAAARALVRMGDPRGVPALRELLAAWRTQGRTLAVQTIGEFRLVELAPELVRLTGRPRAVEPLTLATSLSRLASQAPAAAIALKKLASGSDEFASAARAELENHS